VAENFCGNARQSQVGGCGWLTAMLSPTSYMHRVAYLIEYTNPSNQITAKKLSVTDDHIVLPEWYLNKEAPS